MRISLLGVLLLLLPGVNQARQNCAAADAPVIPLHGLSCDSLPSPRLSCVLMDDVPGKLQQANYNTRQRATDIFAWQDFIALMWPAKRQQRGQAAHHARLDRPGPRVWESWKEQSEVYPADGSSPAAWNHRQPLPAACSQGHKHLYRRSKVHDVLDADLQAVKADGSLPGTLTDQSGRLVHYEIRLNQTLFNYIVEHKLYNGEQQAQAASIDFPDGSILIKAAWRELDAAQKRQMRDQALIREACICDGDDCHPANVALVGFHIMHKTASAPQWIWSTFEQQDNVHADLTATAFYNPNCSGPYCLNNSQAPVGTPNQVTRVLPIMAENPVCSDTHAAIDNVQQLNQDVQAGLRHSVLRNYQLIAAQWPLQQPELGDKNTIFSVLPEFSANTTMETFAQKTSSCMGCHAMSRSLKPDFYVSADFSFTLNNAHPQPQHALCNEYSYSNSMACSDKLLLFPNQRPAQYSLADWAPIRRGYADVTQTYERLGSYVGDRLHCSSCHLHGGGDPAASWWVGMQQVYPANDPKHRTLSERINSCFERSMNGRALCKNGVGDCDSMADIQAYMAWLTARYCADNRCKDGAPVAAPRGFPAIDWVATQPGDSVQGQAIFAQKCAFCHDNNGQGRYLGGYFRPALWGEGSFNQQAGMGKVDKLAPFIRWNMPYTSGGMLSDQEAVDIACYIDGQVRPGKTSLGVQDERCIPAEMLLEE